MADNSTGALVALLGIGVAAFMIISGRGSAAPSPGATGRQDVVSSSFAPDRLDSLEAQLSALASGNSAPTAGAGGAELSAETAPGSPGFTQAIIERTGYLPDGYDAAGRIAINNSTDWGDGSGGFVGL